MSTGFEFLAQLERSDEGVVFLKRYRAFVAKYPYRGHEERDMYYPRRPEDPMIDYRSLRMLQGTPNPVARENEVNTRRNVVIDEGANNILARPFGALKAEIF